MSKAKRKRLEKEAEKQAALTQGTTAPNGKRIIAIIVTAFIAVVALIIGVNHYFSEDQKFYRINVINVDDTSVSMDYFVRRCFASGTDPMSALTGLTQELIIKKQAEINNFTISDQDVEARIIENASGESGTMSQSEYREWLRQRLNETRLSEKEYKDFVRTSLLGERIYDMISRVTPTSGEQIYLHAIVTNTLDEAEQAKARIDAGEEFSAVASEMSIDSATSENGGDLGWIPRSVAFDSRYDTLLFEQLEIGVVSDPQTYYDTSSSSEDASSAVARYLLFMISDKSDNREIDEQYLDAVYAKAYDAWLGQAMSEHTIKYNGIKNGFDSETYSWINWQIQKMTSQKNEDSTETSD
jgi:hypothetical protein